VRDDTETKPGFWVLVTAVIDVSMAKCLPKIPTGSRSSGDMKPELGIATEWRKIA